VKNFDAPRSSVLSSTLGFEARYDPESGYIVSFSRNRARTSPGVGGARLTLPGCWAVNVFTNTDSPPSTDRFAESSKPPLPVSVVISIPGS
jgi:hypothetical protein